MGSVRMYRPAPRMATAEAKIYFRDVVDARGAKTETFQFTPQCSANPLTPPNVSSYSHNLPNFTEDVHPSPYLLQTSLEAPYLTTHTPISYHFPNFLKKK